MASRNNGWANTAKRKGTVLIYTCIGMVAFAAFVSLAVDVGEVRFQKVGLQLAADAAARAACQQLSNGVTAAQNAAVSVAAQNYAGGSPVTLNPTTDIAFGVWNPTTKTFTVLTGTAQANGNAVRVTASHTAANNNAVVLWFATILGKTSADVSATATACLSGNVGNYSIMGLNGITMSLGAYTDSYNSSQGVYTAGSAKSNGSIASNGNISLNGTVVINGNARCGVGKTTTTLGTSVVKGLNAPLGSTMSYPSVTLPATYTDLGDVALSSGNTSMAGGVYLFHSLNLSGTATFTWTSPVTFYVRDSYSVSGNATINTYQNLPANRVIKFLPTCTTATWAGTNTCIGELYAPDTDFTIGGTVEMMGRILAKSITHTGYGGMHYDEALGPPGGTAANADIIMVK